MKQMSEKFRAMGEQAYGDAEGPLSSTAHVRRET
jgi:hypothetical protein